MFVGRIFYNREGQNKNEEGGEANILKHVRTVLGETTYPWRRLLGRSRPISSSATVQRRWTSEATAGEEKCVDGKKQAGRSEPRRRSKRLQALGEILAHFNAALSQRVRWIPPPAGGAEVPSPAN